MLGWPTKSLFGPRPVGEFASSQFEQIRNPKIQFGTRQLMMLTTWLAIVCACFYLDPYWGWLTAVQVLAIAAIGASMLGYRPLGQPALRSWSKWEIGVTGGILGFLWVLRLALYFTD